MKEEHGIIFVGPFRWPPRVSTSLKFGFVGYATVLSYHYGLPPEVAAQMMTNHWIGFWGEQLGMALFTIAALYVILDDIRRAVTGP